jgi:hypothetical protein
MQFQQVNHYIPGKKYKIIHFYGAVFFGTFCYSYEDSLLFKNVSGYGFYEYQEFTIHLNKIYKPIFQKERIQSTMEHRAINIILQQITGDPTFTW